MCLLKCFSLCVSRGGGNSSNRGANSTRTRGNVSNTVSRPVQRNPNNDLAGGDAIVCRCNLDAIQLTVRKDGPNQGITILSVILASFMSAFIFCLL